MIIDCSLIKPGIRFTAPVYFEDAQNLFLGANRPVRAFHISALKRWNVPFLVTEGKMQEELIVQDDEIEELEAFDEDLEEI